MVRLRDDLVAGKHVPSAVFDWVTRLISLIAWQGIDTVIVSAGVSSLRPVLDIARGDSSEEYPGIEGVQRTADVASTALQANYLGPLTAAVTFVCCIPLIGIWNPIVISLSLDSSPRENFSRSFDTFDIVTSLRHTFADASSILFYKRRKSHPLPVTRNWTPLHQVLAHLAIHRWRELPRFGCGWRQRTRSWPQQARFENRWRGSEVYWTGRLWREGSVHAIMGKTSSLDILALSEPHGEICLQKV